MTVNIYRSICFSSSHSTWLSVYSQPHYFKIYNTILKKRRCGDSTYILLCCLTPSHMTQMPYDFQQRMSWLPQRWRTQRNAIRNAICIFSWIIKSLNAHCTACNYRQYAYLSVCKPPYSQQNYVYAFYRWRMTMCLNEYFFVLVFTSNTGLCEIILQTRCTSPHGNRKL